VVDYYPGGVLVCVVLGAQPEEGLERGVDFVDCLDDGLAAVDDCEWDVSGVCIG